MCRMYGDVIVAKGEPAGFATAVAVGHCLSADFLAPLSCRVMGYAVLMGEITERPGLS